MIGILARVGLLEPKKQIMPCLVRSVQEPGDQLFSIAAHSLWPPVAHFRWPCLRREEGAGPEAGPFGTGAAMRGQSVWVDVQLSSGGSTSVTA